MGAGGWILKVAAIILGAAVALFALSALPYWLHLAFWQPLNTVASGGILAMLLGIVLGLFVYIVGMAVTIGQATYAAADQEQRREGHPAPPVVLQGVGVLLLAGVVAIGIGVVDLRDNAGSFGAWLVLLLGVAGFGASLATLMFLGKKAMPPEAPSSRMPRGQRLRRRLPYSLAMLIGSAAFFYRATGSILVTLALGLGAAVLAVVVTLLGF
jgi:hypothetical protein